MVASDPILQHKAVYLNRTFFTLRALVYFAVWIGLGGVHAARATGGGRRDIRIAASR